MAKLLTACAMLAVVSAGCSRTHEAATMRENKQSTSSEKASTREAAYEKATFAGGCFWGVESAFRELPGVVDTQVGYTGGTLDNPTYEDVCSHTTGHAEAVEVTSDPAKVSYEKLVEYFFDIHNPTTMNRQGPDVGDQYRSEIFVHSPQQERIANEVKQRLQNSGKYGKREVVTLIEPAPKFWRAEEYHQRYFEKTGQASCHVKQ